MNDLLITVSGWVATEPRFLAGPSGARMTTFRLASTSRYFDRDKNEWVDGRTEWFTVRVFRAAAVTVAESIAKGQPVTVHGRFKTNTWESDSGPRMDLVIDATSVGHDLTRGVASFSRATGATDLPTEALPAGIAPDSGDADGVDADSGEDGTEGEPHLLGEPSEPGDMDDDSAGASAEPELEAAAAR